MSRYEWAVLNPQPLSPVHSDWFERGSRAIGLSTPSAYARTWVVGYGAGRGQPMLLSEPPREVGRVRGLPIMYAESFGFYVGDYLGEFDTRAQAEAYARSLTQAEEPARVPSLLPLLALLGLMVLV